MRDANRLKERFQLALDGRQVAAVVVGALVILGAVFILGMNVGKQLGERERLARQPADPLAALDTPPALPDAGEPPRLSYHEELTRNRPPEPPRAPAPRPAAPPPPMDVRSGSTSAGGVVAGLEKPPPTPPSAGVESPADEAAPSSGAVSFAIQVGAMQDPDEAQRLADRFKNHKPRIVIADIPKKGRWYRVKVGAFDSKTEAERYLQDLVRETSARGFVTAYK